MNCIKEIDNQAAQYISGGADDKKFDHKKFTFMPFGIGSISPVNIYVNSREIKTYNGVNRAPRSRRNDWGNT